MKMIPINNCVECPHGALQRDFPGACALLVMKQETNEYEVLRDSVRPNCPLSDYPESLQSSMKAARMEMCEGLQKAMRGGLITIRPSFDGIIAQEGAKLEVMEVK